MESVFAILSAIMVLIVGVFVYFLPAVVAHSRSHQSSGAILILNLLLGWTFLGWVIALVWAATAVQHPTPR